jgi:L,D-transpeptidase YcbB
MKKKAGCIKAVIVSIMLLFGFVLHAQVDSAQLQHFLQNEKMVNGVRLKYANSVQEFYKLLDYKTAWIQRKDALTLAILYKSIKNAADNGLNPGDYSQLYIQSFLNNKLSFSGSNDSVVTELLITDAAVHYYTELSCGNTKPPLGYNGLNYTPSCTNIAEMMANYILNGKLHLLPMHLSASLPEIGVLERKIKTIYTRIAEEGFADATVISNKVNTNNKPLLSRLYQLGILSSVTEAMNDSTLKQKLKEAQRLFSLMPDGILRTTLLQELNIPLAVRVKQLSISVNYYRWLHCLTNNQSVIVVNIPAAYLKVYKNNTPVLEMKMIVGKRSTPTPTLASAVNEVILYPYWHVPNSIAVKELLPLIKKNPGYVDAGNYQVLDRNGKIINPYTVNWHSLHAGYFPYLIRQSTGCDNALGLLKLNFYNPFGVYLHDTPGKNLFSMNKRYFSHGCMRMEKPMELGHLILTKNAVAIDTLEQKGCLKNQAPVIVRADEQMPVIVWYNLAGIDREGKLVFFEDVYHKFEWMTTK